MNRASACLAPKSRPSAESPACSSTGCRCGEAGAVATPRTVNCGPR
ncbi:Uncharacterised protein [Mycobacteroides abscessus subsp. abscessus]|nr:Uncharacterised protein [Mycobacteroides abscessus subsp. abscessus]